jgi:hypothetical protein
VQLVPYNPDFLDDSRIWMESHNVGNGFRCVHMVNSMYLNFDALHGIYGDTDVVLWKWCEGDNQRWNSEDPALLLDLTSIRSIETWREFRSEGTRSRMAKERRIATELCG